MDIRNAASSTLSSVPSVGHEIGTSQQVSTTAPASAASAVAPSVAIQPASRADVENATETLNKFMQSANRNLAFSIDDESGEVIVKITDLSTDEVIRQIPTEEALNISRSLDKLQGLLLREQA